MPRVPKADPSGLTDLGDYRSWRPEAQQRALELLEQRQAKPWLPFYCRLAACDGRPHGQWAHNHARADQHPPQWFADWLVWLIMSGRGAGKTRTGSEVSHRVTEIYSRLIFVAPTGPDFRDTMVEDPDSGLLATAPPGKMPEWEPSKKKLTWPNGCVALGFSAEEPDRLRGKQSGFFWFDEPAHYPDLKSVWDNTLFGHRVAGKKGAQPKGLMTSTPKPLRWLKEKIAEPTTVLTRVSSYANIDNLAESYKRNVLDKYKGTRLGRQELEGEILEDVEGALWTWDLFIPVADHPALARIVVAVDPAGSTTRRADETGIVVVGVGYDKSLYVLADHSGKYGPSQWADKAMAAYEFFGADAIVAEKNYGGDMVRNTLENSRLAKHLMPRIKLVESRRGKSIRAEPVVALYEKKRVKHVGERGALTNLEGELTSWVPGEGASPNRLDALVHGVTDLMGAVGDVTWSSPADLAENYRAPIPESAGTVPAGINSGFGAGPSLPSPYQGLRLPSRFGRNFTL